jgi:glycine oxidase
MHDVLIIGGGVIGLSLAWDLARHGKSVHLIDRGSPGREASWAGAGILPAARRDTARHPYDQLCGLASELHPQWAAELRSLTGIDTGYRRCGGIYLARTAGEGASLAAWGADQAELGVAVQRLSANEIATVEPGLASGGRGRASGGRGSRRAETVFHVAYLLPEEAQLRNPRHLQALVAACSAAGVEVSSDLAGGEVSIADGQVTAIATDRGPLRARQYCFTAGAWTGQLLSPLGMAVNVLPMRGQMLLFRCDEPPLAHILNEGSRYLVPRDDGRVLVGSTEEEVGFDKRTTAEGLADLATFARSLVPALASAPIEHSWAGLRPASLDGLPYLGPLPGLANAFVASGHFRSGLYLSPATAVVMSQLMRAQSTTIDLAPFRVTR